MNLSAKSRIALGQTGLMVSLVLTAAFLGLIPDRHSAVLEGRAALAEVLAVNSSMLISESDLRRLQIELELVVSRNADLRSAGVRAVNGELMVIAGDHEERWTEMPGEFSTDAQVRVPILAGRDAWGQVELQFRPLIKRGWLGWLGHPFVKLSAFIALGCFIAFYFYLGKMLKHLDPSQAVPNRVRTALDTMAEGLLVLDLKGRIMLANQAFASLLDEDAEALVGKEAATLTWVVADGGAAPESSLPWVGALATGIEQRNVTVRLARSGGAPRTLMVNCSPVLGSGGKHGGALVSFDDVTELEEIEIELRHSKREAEEANQAKSAFLANMSHEIRTPMNAILGFTEVLRRGYDRDATDSLKYLNTIHSSGKHLLDLINDILDLSKVESGHLEVESARFAPHQIIQETLKFLRVKAQEKNIELQMRLDGEVPESIVSDPARLRQMVTNLVGNAIKFTSTGGVTVTTRLRDDALTPQLEIEVSDTGVGMESDRLERIFDPFVQADSSVARQFGGTGLGLAISRRFARALGGDVVVGSVPGEGSSFRLTIDTGSLHGVRRLSEGELTSPEEETKSTAETRWEFPAARILVVDDGEENRELVKLVLGQVGLQVDEAENGQVGLDMATHGIYDAVLMDVQMPVMDGLTATRKLREQGSSVPVVALTANAMKGFDDELTANGFSGYLTKPVDIDALVQMLAEHLGARQSEIEPEREAEIVGEEDRRECRLEPEARTPMAGLEPIASTLGGNPRFQPLVSRFIDRLHEQLAAMETAYRERDLVELAGLAHWLKGAAGTVGFDVFTEPAGQIEQLVKSGNADGAVECLLGALKAKAARLVVQTVPDNVASTGNNRVEPKTALRLVAPTQAPLAPAEATASANEIPERVVSRLATDPRLGRLVTKFLIRLVERTEAFEQAWAARDYQALGQLAHWLKGSGGTLGFDAFTEPAQCLEELSKSGDEAAIGVAVQRVCALTTAAIASAPSDHSPRPACHPPGGLAVQAGGALAPRDELR